MMPKPAVARVLTIAGSDSGGGAGIAADLKTFTALNVFGMVALTAVTAQNTVSVEAAHDLPPNLVADQIDAVARDIGVDAAKTGMLSSAEIIEAVAQSLTSSGIKKLVVDPVMVAKSGDPLLRVSARAALIEKIIPLAHVITPNVPEAEVLSGLDIRTEKDVHEAARRIHGLGAKYVIIKGGHLDTAEAAFRSHVHAKGEQGPATCEDYFFDGRAFEIFSGPRIHTPNTHGTGCTYSAAIAAFLGQGMNIHKAVQAAKKYLIGAIQHSFALGHGHGPLNHFWNSAQKTIEPDSDVLAG